MSTEAHKALIRRHFAEVTNGKDLAEFQDVIGS